MVLISFLCSLFFIHDGVSSEVQIIAFMIVLIFNLRFLILWVMCLLLTLNYRWTQAFAGRMRKYVLSQQ